jgi:hypothetical protein
MIPPQLNVETSSSAERLLFRVLQEGLDDGRWTVIHSLPWLDDRQRFLKDGQGECDFLLLHPEKGMLAIEAKSGCPRYDGQEGGWFQDQEGRPPNHLKDPFWQAQRSAHFLDDLLCREVPGWREAGLPFGYAVAFPEACNVIGNLPPEALLDLFLLEPDLDRIQDRVTRILGRFNVRTGDIDPEVFQAGLRALRPQFRLVPSLRARVEDVNRELVRLTEEQARTLGNMRRNKRLYVCGGAGTGKTLLMVEQAERLARSYAGDEAPEARVLVLCYNNSLEAHLRDRLGENDRIDVFTFHGVCREIVEGAGEEVDFPEPGKPRQGFWDKELPEQAFDCLAGYETRYRAILVDEAQDFRTLWWAVVEELLAKADGSERFYLFGDEGQDLYGRGSDLPFDEPCNELSLNCRNTRQVACWVQEAAQQCAAETDDADGEDDSSRLPTGPEVREVMVADEKAEVDAIRKELHHLIREQGIRPEQVVVLGRHNMEKSCLGARRRRLGNWEIVAEGEDIGHDGVRYVTIHKFKGLEADFVILTGVGVLSEHCSAEDDARFRYVGGSRARVGLVVLKFNQTPPVQNTASGTIL